MTPPAGPEEPDYGQAVIEGDTVVIRISLVSLPTAVEGAWASYGLPTRMKVTDVKAFAKELVIALNREEEDGTTRIHTMFDGAINEAIEQGAEGIEEHEDQNA